MLSNELGDGGLLLAIANVDAGEVISRNLLVDGGVDGCLASLTIAVDQPMMTTSDGDEGIDSLEAGKKTGSDTDSRGIMLGVLSCDRECVTWDDNPSGLNFKSTGKFDIFECKLLLFTR